MTDLTLRQFIDKYDKGEFDKSTKSMIGMGWYDWFCSDSSLYNRLKPLVSKVKKISKSKKIDLDKMYVFFKNNCPCVGPTYDDFRICNIESGDVIYCICKLNKGCYGNDFSGWTMWYDNGTDFDEWCKSWDDIKEYFEI